MIGEIFRILFPDKCLLCGAVLDKGEFDLCGQCREHTPEYTFTGRALPGIGAMTAVWYYEGAVRDSILGFKFRGKRSRADGYGRALAMRVLRDLPGPEVVVAVPISAKRLKERGYDQAELLARAVAKELGCPYVSALRKHKDNAANSSLETADERRANVRGVYRVEEPGSIAGKRVLLIDDIVTTGATACECARQLRHAGAADVVFGAIAATEYRNQAENR